MSYHDFVKDSEVSLARIIARRALSWPAMRARSLMASMSVGVSLGVGLVILVISTASVNLSGGLSAP